ncbi:carotenoid oxygenase family protein [Rhodococcus sp. IEGM 1305]|uniref:carotenoid oxygenase family protein n=1 Tax=Rhodococcus sp. IEGM 1305 TaxID=3047092 RepID=UPI0024B6D5ED|nr:carotenoid oxygenase family protein [Rhodococcus sp. IEGM 1305]MDI9953290.1 carotenoid oxygenase family protein [Rhodococcus sp. IEGM 1305]
MGYPIPTDARFKGPFQPMRFEATVEECIVTHGEIPKDIAGGFYRTGPTWKRPTKQGTDGLLSMDGMVQGLVIENGNATFRNRWIRTPKYVLEEQHGKGMFAWTDGDWHDWRNFGLGDVVRDMCTKGVPQGTNNVNIFPFQGKMVATADSVGAPIAIDPITLDTIGIVPWSTQLSAGIHEKAAFGDAGFTAHPKWDPETGELYGWAYRDRQPYVTLHFVNPDGTVRSRDITDAPYNTVAHDIWLTPEHVVMPFQPFLVDKQRILQDKSVYAWEPDLPIVLALIPRRDINGPIKWVTMDVEPQYVMHTMSGNMTGSRLTLDAPIFNRPPFPFEQDFADGDDVALFFSIAKSHLGRWTVDLETGATKSEQLSDRPSELPKVDERFYGKGYRWGYQVGGRVKRSGMSMNSLVITDMHTLQDQEYQIRHEQPAGVLEATFVPRTLDAPEGDGYIIVPVSWWAENRGEYLIFDTHDITKGPITRIDIPFRLGWTAHGHWMDFR